jgi:hypothetical protein
MRYSALSEQTLQFGLSFSSDAVRKRPGALSLFRPERGQTGSQVWLVVFQAAQKPLGPGNSLVQGNHQGLGGWIQSAT